SKIDVIPMLLHESGEAAGPRVSSFSNRSPGSGCFAFFRVNSRPPLLFPLYNVLSAGRNRLQPETASPKSQLRREMGFWDVLLFNIAAVLGPRWIAAAAHTGTSSISLWILAAVLFFLPTALIILELSTRSPAEGGLYVWSKEAFGDFHGFVAGWAYWVYTFFYFPGLLTASVAMSVFIGGPKFGYLALSKNYLFWASLGLLAIA